MTSEHFFPIFLCFSRRQGIPPRVALPPPTRNPYSRSTSFDQQSGVYSRSSSFGQQTSGFQQSESFKQRQPAATRRPDSYSSESSQPTTTRTPDTYASESTLDSRLVRVFLCLYCIPTITYPSMVNKFKTVHHNFEDLHHQKA
jgi:E3 ubiquitin-protein ligase RGLG